LRWSMGRALADGGGEPVLVAESGGVGAKRTEVESLLAQRTQQPAELAVVKRCCAAACLAQ